VWVGLLLTPQLVHAAGCHPDYIRIRPARDAVTDLWYSSTLAGIRPHTPIDPVSEQHLPPCRSGICAPSPGRDLPSYPRDSSEKRNDWVINPLVCLFDGTGSHPCHVKNELLSPQTVFETLDDPPRFLWHD
jgi:hypothetical protein